MAPGCGRGSGANTSSSSGHGRMRRNDGRRKDRGPRGRGSGEPISRTADGRIRNQSGFGILATDVSPPNPRARPRSLSPLREVSEEDETTPPSAPPTPVCSPPEAPPIPTILDVERTTDVLTQVDTTSSPSTDTTPPPILQDLLDDLTDPSLENVRAMFTAVASTLDRDLALHAEDRQRLEAQEKNLANLRMQCESEP